MSFFTDPAFLSIVSGIIAVVLFHFCVPTVPPAADATNATSAKTKQYAMVFLTVAVLVYGSFAIANKGGSMKYAVGQAEIQTGGRPPF